MRRHFKSSEIKNKKAERDLGLFFFCCLRIFDANLEDGFKLGFETWLRSVETDPGAKRKLTDELALRPCSKAFG